MKRFLPLFILTGLLFGQEWTQTYGGTTGDETGKSVKQTTDGGYIICGWRDMNLYLIKTDNVGDSL